MKWLIAIALTGALVGLSGCQTSEGGAAAAGTRYVVSSDRTAFYENGPAQDYGPDFTLSQGQEVEMIERSFGFSRVKSDLGKIGYVSTDDLAPAPPRPDPTPGVVADGGASTSSFSAEPRGLDYEDVVTDLPAPVDEPTPVTGFRY